VLEESSPRSFTDKPTTLVTFPVCGLPLVANSESSPSSPSSPSTSACATSKPTVASAHWKVRRNSDTRFKSRYTVVIKSQDLLGRFAVLTHCTTMGVFVFSSYLCFVSSFLCTLSHVSKQTNGNTNPSILSEVLHAYREFAFPSIFPPKPASESRSPDVVWLTDQYRSRPSEVCISLTLFSRLNDPTMGLYCS